jgi:transposase
VEERQNLEPKAEVLRKSGALNPRPEVVADELFQSQDFFDPRDLVQVKYEMLRRASQKGMSVSESAAAFGFSRPSFYRIQADFEAQGLTGLLPRRRGPQGRHKLTPEVIEFVLQALAEDPALRAAGLAERVQERFGLSVHPRSVDRALVSSKKKPPEGSMSRPSVPPDWVQRYEGLRAAALDGRVALFLRRGLVGWMAAWDEVAPSPPPRPATASPVPGDLRQRIAEEVVSMILAHRQKRTA